MKTSTPLPKDWREGRRLRAWELYEQGWPQNKIAQALGVTEGAVSQWITKGKAQGPEALRHQPSPGAPPKLSPAQRAQLPGLLAQGAEAFGFRGQVWTAARVAVVIKREFGVSYHPTHCSRLLAAIKHSRQKPETRASQRDEHAIQVWRDHHSVEVKKGQRGETPILSVPLTREHFSAIGGLTLDGRLVMHIEDHSFKGPDVVRFLQLLLRKIRGKLLVIWDGARIHRSGAVKDFLGAGGAKRIHLERLPGYAPELNPEVRVWNLLKRRELKNLCAADFEQLRIELVRAKERLRHRKPVLRQCIAHAGFPL